jgi:hypothetical protein
MTEAIHGNGRYARVRVAARHSGVSINTFRSWLRRGLPHYRLPSGIVLVAYTDIDDFLARFRVLPDEEHQGEGKCGLS